MKNHPQITSIILRHYPAIQGIYLFGSQMTGQGNDIDLALLLPHNQAKTEKNMAFSSCRFELEEELHLPVDLINARAVSTVFQKEIISGELIYSTDRLAIDEFEMLTLSYYQKLNDERAEIIQSFQETGRAYVV